MGTIRASHLAEEEPVEVRAVNLRMTPRTGTIEKCPGGLIMEERGVAVAFQTEHALFPPLQEKLVRRPVRRVTDRAPLDTTGEMFECKWSTFLDMAPCAGLVVYTPQRKTTQAPVRRMAVRALHGAFQHLVTYRQGKSASDLPVTGEAQLRCLLAQEVDGHHREMGRMTVITGNPGELMLATPELKLLGFLLVTGETDLGSGLG